MSLPAFIVSAWVAGMVVGALLGYLYGRRQSKTEHAMWILSMQRVTEALREVEHDVTRAREREAQATTDEDKALWSTVAQLAERHRRTPYAARKGG